MALPCGGVGDARCLQEDGADIPATLAVADQVETGLVEADLTDFEASSPEGSEADGSGDALRTQYRLGAESRVLVHEEIAQLKAGKRQQAQRDR